MPQFQPNHILSFRPLRAGMAIQNPLVSRPGTLGFMATLDGQDRWIVSCYHVLCRLNGPMPANNIEPIVCPFENAPRQVVAHVSGRFADDRLDCAAARVLDGIPSAASILGVASLRLPPQDPVVGMRVIKSGAATGVTEGRIEAISHDSFGHAIVEISAMEFPPEYELSNPGDSGALWVDATTLAPVALHYEGNLPGQSELARARPIQLVLDSMPGLRMIS